MRVHLNHVLVQLRVLAHHNLRIPRGSHKDSLNATLQGCSEAVGDLQTDEESIGDDDGSESAVSVVGRVGEDEVEVGEAVEGKLLAVLRRLIWRVWRLTRHRCRRRRLNPW